MKKILLTLFCALLFPLPLLAQNIVSSKTNTILATGTIDTSAYASGDLVGSKQTLGGAGACDSISGPLGLCGGIIHSVTITDKDKQSADFDIIIFSSNPTGTTFTDNAPFTVADNDLSKIACVIQVTTDVLFADNGVAIANGTNCVFDARATKGTLYAAVVIRSAATYSSTGLSFRYNILQD